ncbi:MAG: sigma-70 family RNA polymerase sigma factor [Anaerolineae bacterium]|nr:sigma-70 family RNA polymerase sigma factor [Anaerolineae bacterium]
MLPLSLDARASHMNNVPARELDLISAAQRGDISAFNQLVRAYQEPVYRLAFHVLDDSGAAEQATQTTFETAYRTIKRWKGEPIKVWLLRNVIRQCKRLDRAVRFRAPHSGAVVHSPIEMGLAVLTPDERIICVLADIMGLNEQEISRITDMDTANIRSKRHRARLEIRNVLQFAGTAQV